MLGTITATLLTPGPRLRGREDVIVLSQVQSNGFIMDDSQTILMTGLEKNFDSVYRPSPSRVIMTDPLKGFGLLSNLTTAAPEGSGATTGTRTTTRILLDISILI